MFWNFIFYGMIAVGAILFVSLTIYRIDWARHPEKYKDLVEDEDGADYSSRSTDPVRMYLREMGAVNLLDRDGEVLIAKKINCQEVVSIPEPQFVLRLSSA